VIKKTQQTHDQTTTQQQNKTHQTKKKKRLSPSVHQDERPKSRVTKSNSVCE
jgi:hypothetical protein